MKYKVGDRVRVRQWETMARQYKVRNDGDIEIIGTPHYFIKEKKSLCGQVVTIEKVVSDYYHIKEDGGYWEWTDEMFEGYAFEYGEVAEFSNDSERWERRIYVGYIDGSNYPYIVVDEWGETSFRKGESFACMQWRYARPIPRKHTIIIDGVEIKVSDEDYKALKEKLCGEK